jgi:hypothetical protein
MHNNEVLQELGFSSGDIARLFQLGVVTADDGSVSSQRPENGSPPSTQSLHLAAAFADHLASQVNERSSQG